MADSAPRMVSRGLTWSGWISASSSCSRSPVIGVLSSWEVTAANWAWRSAGRSARPMIHHIRRAPDRTMRSPAPPMRYSRRCVPHRGGSTVPA